MALVLADRIKETTTTTGTGTITLAGAVAGFRAFSIIGNGSTTYYVIAGQTTTEWEVGLGTYTAAGTTLARNTVLASSNFGTLVNFSAGTKDVWCNYPAHKAVTGQFGMVENDNTINNDVTINSGRNAMSAGPITISTGVTVTVPTGSTWTIV